MPLAAGHRNSIFFFMFNLNFVSASAAFFFLNSGFFLLSQGVPRNSLLSFSYRKKPSSFAVSHFFLAWFVLLSTFVFVAFFTLTSNLSNGTDASSGKGDCTCSLTLFFYLEPLLPIRSIKKTHSEFPLQYAPGIEKSKSDEDRSRCSSERRVF